MLFQRFCRESRGSVLPMFAITVIPMIGIVGAAIDFSRAGAVRTEMQGALDATALMLSKEPAGQSNTQLSEKADTYFKAMFNRRRRASRSARRALRRTAKVPRSS
jgi:Flp pilus assembly protein TadG